MKQTRPQIIMVCQTDTTMLVWFMATLSPLMEAVEGALDKKNVLGESLVVWEIMITNTTRANARITLVRRSADKQILGVGEHGLAIGSGMEVVGHRVLFQVNEHLVSFGDDQIDMSQPMGVPTFIFYTISALFSPIAIQ